MRNNTLNAPNSKQSSYLHSCNSRITLLWCKCLDGNLALYLNHPEFQGWRGNLV